MTKEQEDELLAIATVRYPIDTRYIGLHNGDKRISEHKPTIIRSHDILYGIDVGLDYVYRPSMRWAKAFNESGDVIEFPESSEIIINQFPIY